MNQLFWFQPVAFVTFESRDEAEEAKASLQVRKRSRDGDTIIYTTIFLTPTSYQFITLAQLKVIVLDSRYHL